MYTTIKTSLENGICIITMNRPAKLNALNKTVMDELDAVIGEIYSDQEIKSAIITGAGNKSFVAGADITEFEPLSVEEGKVLAKKGQDLFFKIEDAPKPIIACVNGFALGGGCELAMACHLRIASENAMFGQPEVNLGLIPGYGGTQRLTQLIGKGRALELIMSGKSINAETALQFGLVNYIVPQDELIKKAVSLLEIIHAKAPLAIAKSITAVNAVFNEMKNGYAVELNSFGDCFGTNDVKEGIKAFIEKRSPDFKGN